MGFNLIFMNPSLKPFAVIVFVCLAAGAGAQTPPAACINAPSIAQDSQIPLPSPNTDYWYAAALQAGETYVVEWTAGKGWFYLYNACGGSVLASGNTLLYTPAQQGTYRILAEGYVSGSRFRARAIAAADPLVCANARSIPLDADTPPPSAGVHYWYSVTLQAGAPYIVEWTAGSGYAFDVYQQCGGGRLSGGDPAIITPAQSGSHYIRAFASSSGSRFRVREIGAAENIICANATAIQTAAPAAPPAIYRDYWYSITLDAHKPYIAEWTEGGGNFYLYDSCGGAILQSGSPAVYTPAARQTFYINAAAHWAGSRFVIRELTAAENLICANALPLALNAKTALPLAHTEYWYSLTLQAGASYAAEWTGGTGEPLMLLRGGCHSDYIGFHDGYTSGAGGTYFVRAYARDTGSIFMITERPVVLGVDVAPQEITLRRGYARQFAASVSLQNSPPLPSARNVVWSISSDSIGASITANGLLTIDAAAVQGAAFVVRAAAVWDASQSGTARVTIADSGYIVPPAVLEVSVLPTEYVIYRGETKIFAAIVETEGGASREVTWSVEGGSASIIDRGGVLAVSGIETADTLYITAASVHDPAKQGRAKVIVRTLHTPVLAEQTPPLQIYPNPAGDILYISNAFAGAAEVYAVTGALVLAVIGNVINISRLPAGTYIVRADGRTAKIVKK